MFLAFYLLVPLCPPCYHNCFLSLSFSLCSENKGVPMNIREALAVVSSLVLDLGLKLCCHFCTRKLFLSTEPSSKPVCPHLGESTITKITGKALIFKFSRCHRIGDLEKISSLLSLFLVNPFSFL